MKVKEKINKKSENFYFVLRIKKWSNNLNVKFQ